ncbi:MAG: single-stranded-DNA-specific exonuclease RecJ [Acidobacteria bacterium]|nr:single-stranded-DNA-specific exonuclease RecJ [Acidobacteriota bacterium]
MEGYWEYHRVKYDTIKSIADELRLPVIIARILVNRGYSTPEEADKFLNPKIEDMYDPFLMNGMDIVIDRILKALDKHEKICIYGDYDVDGVTSIIILKDALQRLGGNVIFTIPSRLDEGYGLNFERLDDQVLGSDTKLIITVDTGTTSTEEANYLLQKGRDLIITDHHEEGNERPNALAILNPKLSENTYPFKELAGVGVILKLVQALQLKITKKLPIQSYLKIAAIGTIADIVPLIDENRIIAKLGLRGLQATNNFGLRSLLADLKLEDRKIESSDISFRLAPRINALGRLGNVEQAVELFFTSNRAYANEIVLEMNRLNVKRQKLENDIYEHAVHKIESDEKLQEAPILIIQGNDWHLGVIGIVASRLTNKYYKPSIVISLNGGLGKASGRSITDFDLKGALDLEYNLLESYGGHKMAVGFQIREENIAEFAQRISGRVEKILDGHLFIREDKIDADISFQAINDEFLKALDKLKPFGHSNPKPVFRSNNVFLKNTPYLLKEKHIKAQLEQGRKSFESICWKHPDWYEDMNTCNRLDIIYHINKNYWYGEESIQLEIKDFTSFQD